ncbi:MAG TPA: hypothetical protein VGD95_02180 [Micavibrio sp.]
MNLIRKISQNRLKAVSLLAVVGDVFMALSGAEGLVLRQGGTEGMLASTYSLILASGSLALWGHLMLAFWGKGARDERITVTTPRKEPPILAKPFFPWRYPLDSALFVWLLAGTSYTLSGWVGGDLALLLMGAAHVCACLIGWLYPKDKSFMGLGGMQMTAILYLLSTVCTYWAAWTLQSWLIFAAACAYCACNLILYTMNKHNQSSFTQTHEA